MCRWNAYSGEPLMLDELLVRTENGLEVPESVVLVFEAGSHEQLLFHPQPPWTTADGNRLVGREV